MASNPKGVDLTSKQRARYETQLARAYRQLDQAAQEADARGDYAISNDLDMIRMELERMVQDSLKSRHRPLRAAVLRSDRS